MIDVIDDLELLSWSMDGNGDITPQFVVLQSHLEEENKP